MARDVSCMFQEVRDNHVGGQNEVASGEQEPVSEENNTGCFLVFSLLILYLIPSFFVNKATHFSLCCS